MSRVARTGFTRRRASGEAAGIRWLEVAKVALTTLAIPATLVWVSHEFTVAEQDRVTRERAASDAQTMRDSSLKAYSDLLNRREESDVGVRSQVFSTLLGHYFDPLTIDPGTSASGKGALHPGSDITKRLTVLELLATNFDESLNLNPLFWQLDHELDLQPEARRPELHQQLSRIATNVKSNQIEVLRASGAMAEWPLTISDDGFSPLAPKPLRFRDPSSGVEVACVFTLTIIDFEPARRRLLANVTTDSAETPARADSPCLGVDDVDNVVTPKAWRFYLDEYDFPYVNFTRVSEGARFSLAAVSQTDATHITLSLVFFPSSRGSSHDRPYLDTIISKLNQSPMTAPEKATAKAK